MSDKTDRPRRRGEDVIAWAEATGRVTAATAPQWRALLQTGETTERFIESLASIYPPAASAGASSPAAGASSSAEGPAAELLRSMTGSDNRYREVRASGVPVPELFPGSGDLPSATVSGLDPGKLAAAPWWCRPAIAEAPTLTDAEELLAAALDDPAVLEASDRAFSRAAGYIDFQAGVRAAVMDAGRVKVEQDTRAQEAAARQARASATSAPSPQDMTDDELYEAAYGERDRRREQLKASRRRGGVELRNHWDGTPR